MSRREILAAYAENCGGASDWLVARLAAVDEPRGQVDELLPDGRTVRVTESRTADGGLLCVSQDVSDLETSDKLARTQDDQMQYFSASSLNWLWETDADLRFTYMSSNVERITGTPPESHYGKTREELLGPGNADDAWREHLELLRQRKPFENFEYYRVVSDAKPIWISTSGIPVFDANGIFQGYRGLGRDITKQKQSELALLKSERELREARGMLERHVEERTRELRHEIGERKRAERALQESERRFRQAFEFAPIGIALLTPEGKRLKVNRELAEFLGSTVEELRHTSMSSAVTSSADLAIDEGLRQEVIDGKRTTYHNERSYRRKDGTIVWGEVTGSLVRDEDGTPLYFIAHTVDTTERRQNEQLLREANENLEKRVAERTQELHATNEALRQEISERERIRQSLQESEIRFQDFASSASDWFWETDAEHRFTAFLDPQGKLPKVRRLKYLGKTRLDAAAATIENEKWQSHQADLDARRPFRNFEYSIKHEDREWYWSVNGRPFFDAQGNFAGYRGTGTDITEQVQLQRKLNEQTTLLRNILDNLPLHVALLDSKGRYTFISEYGAEKLGRITSDFIGKTDEELFDLSTGASFSAAAKEVLRTGIPVINGTLRPALWNNREALLSIVPMSGMDQTSASVLIVAQDVTELSEAQAAVRDREGLLNAIVEHIPASMTMKRVSDGVYLFTNEQFTKRRGLPKERIIGSQSERVYSDMQQVLTIARHENRVMQSRKAVIEEREIASVDGLRRMSVTKFPVFDEAGAIVSIGSITVDVTEQRRIEEQLRHSQKMEVVGQLTGGVAHDFNNLLGVVIGNLDFLEERVQNDPEMHKLVSTATNAALHGGELTRQLLAFSRRQPLKPRKLDLNLQLVQLHAMLRRTLGETVTVDLKRNPKLWRCEADPSQVEAAILNLAINARDAMPDGGRLVLATTNAVLRREDVANDPELEAGEYVLLSVTDTGFGMAPAVLERAFEPFFTTKKVGQGSGLGLSMVFGFAKQSRGHVTIQSEEGVGTTVNLYLPRARSAEAMTPAPQRSEIPAGNGEQVLVVEDDPDLRLITVTQLENLGYRIIATGDGKSAIEALETSGPIDMLLTDVVLPGGMDGTVLAREIQQRQPGLKVLLMSGYSDHPAVQRNLDSTFTLLQKPFRKEQLAVKVRETLTR
jgi:PAS domain S-box-containing protein